ncbi:TRAP transporter substrate-binding protein DctP [Azospirillum thermophilum]|uniref:C4-dicarboxylate ABC transporter substrate-binding protein n=1 Tax=Azospirillum thermophilum TaxID=2202148 RepID=A0A2S2CZ92_9PROT|nr:TRAP transporter substrate-binding protein DctP [Azospirillum thermophilum]AWK89843.1 C4-dicarboxylate ABC transporter substrate-binding protein [Azospirillum thermophilum]
MDLEHEHATPARGRRGRIETARRVLAAAAAVLLAAGLAARPATAEETLRAVTAFAKPVAFTQSFLRFVDKVNTAGKGVVKITVMGGPEVIPPAQQAESIRRGVVDMQYGPGTYYLSDVPEVDAFVGSTVTPEEARRSGGLKIMQDVYRKKLGAHLLGHFDAGINFYIFTIKEPRRTPDGGVDLSGMRLRSQPIYRELFTALNALSVSIPAPDVYTGLERGIVEGVGWPLVGVTDLSWDRYLKYRIEPGFFQGDLVAIVNQKKWDSLSPQAREILEKAATEHEAESRTAMAELGAATDRKIQAAGLKVVTLEGTAGEAFRRQAFETAWSRLKASNSPDYDALRKAYYAK